MATKIICDACPQDITDRLPENRYGIRIAVVFDGGSEPEHFGPYDLCRQCATDFPRKLNPAKWFL